MAPSSAPAQKAFDRLKTLAGTWQGTAGEKSTVVYKVTAGGSALVETQLPGTEMEMISVYHMDGDRLLMTHYCAAHNQPTMKLIPGKDPSKLRFEFVSGTNMKPADMHMHSVVFHLIDKDHMVSDWTSFMKGKSAGSVKFEMHRVKA
ncbi:hypothetical protein OP10G_4489 [Fimbriimonas ginsengisoli Gsoil 348]|uniref:DUF1579 domain-containing protein n=1 Tax=Fimbriimonas ginsengisoli Gsoil 348 TaxID=661478 RepID=A0A068NWV9_FIMGI|nr:hypothetical protein OP10G_4489 [Fimbriimonas ginsengisoli Gsoil 348]